MWSASLDRILIGGYDWTVSNFSKAFRRPWNEEFSKRLHILMNFITYFVGFDIRYQENPKLFTNSQYFLVEAVWPERFEETLHETIWKLSSFLGGRRSIFRAFRSKIELRTANRVFTFSIKCLTFLIHLNFWKLLQNTKQFNHILQSEFYPATVVESGFLTRCVFTTKKQDKVIARKLYRKSSDRNSKIHEITMGILIGEKKAIQLTVQCITQLILQTTTTLILKSL